MLVRLLLLILIGLRSLSLSLGYDVRLPAPPGSGPKGYPFSTWSLGGGFTRAIF